MNKFSVFLAALPLLVACNSQTTGEVDKPLTPFAKGQQLRITSQPLNEYERSYARRVHVREEVVDSTSICEGDEKFITRLLWDQGDQIDVFVKDSTATHPERKYPQEVFTLVAGANTSEGIFSGKMPADGTVYAIMYPHRDTTEATRTIVEDSTMGGTEMYKVTQFYMPEEQTYRSPDGNTHDGKDWPTFASGLLPIFGKGNLDSGFVTYPCGGALRFKLWSTSGETVRTIRLATHNNSHSLTGSFKIEPTSESGVMKMTPKGGSGSSTGLHQIWLKIPGGITLPKTADSAVWFYFVLPAPLTFTGGFGIYTYDTEYNGLSDYNHCFLSATAAEPTIKQNHITTIIFGSTDEKGNNGDINGGGWNKTSTP